MKKNILIILSSAACMLVSCDGTTRLPATTEDNAMDIAKKMFNRHSDGTLFQLPNKFVITTNSNRETETNTPSEGHTKSWSKEHTVWNFDLDNLYYKMYQKSESQSGTSEMTYYRFYDNASGTLYYAYNYNGYKTRRENKITADAAKSRLEENRNDLLDYITRDRFLQEFENTIKSARESHEKYITEKDQYYNYFVGSADAKSLQYSVEIKLKQTQIGDPEYSGYSQSTSSIIFQNDLFSSYSSNGNTELKTNDGKFYKKSSGKSTSATSYGSCPIEKPNIGEYILK